MRWTGTEMGILICWLDAAMAQLPITSEHLKDPGLWCCACCTCRLRRVVRVSATLATGLQQRLGSANPFDGMSVDLIAVPRAADWDGDGDTDLLLSGFHSADGGYDGSVRYFERMEDGSLQERVGPDNPFRSFVPDGEMVVVPRAVDWDSDGDLDLLVAGAAGQVRYFERLVDGSLQEHLGADSPFNGLEVGHGAPGSMLDIALEAKGAQFLTP